MNAAEQTYRQKPRMLGAVRLEVHGSSQNPELTAALGALIARSVHLTGSLLIAYPAGTGAVLVSDHGQVTVIDLAPGTDPGDYGERQDAAFTTVDRLLRMNPEFMDGRTPRIAVQTITMGAGILQPVLEHQQHPLANPATIVRALENLQANTAPDRLEPRLDRQQVLKQLMWMPSTAGW